VKIAYSYSRVSSVEQLKAGKAATVMQAWTHAEGEFQPTYENRAQYRQIVDQRISQPRLKFLNPNRVCHAIKSHIEGFVQFFGGVFGS